MPNPPLFRYLRREANLTDSKEPMRFQEREERIRAKAQDLWEKERRPEGKADEHWYRAAADIDREVEADTKSSNETGRGGGDRSGVRQGTDHTTLRDSAKDTPIKPSEAGRHQDQQAQREQNPGKQSQQSATPDRDRYPGKPQHDEDEDKDAKQARENLDRPTPRA